MTSDQDMTPEALAELERIARAASVQAIHAELRDKDGIVHVASRRYDDTRHSRLYALAQAATPDTVLALLSAARERDELRAALEAEELTNDRLRDEIAQAVGDREKLAAEVERWKDPESEERQQIQEEIIFSLGEGSRSEIELREGQLEATEVVLALARAEVERLTKERDGARALAQADSLKLGLVVAELAAVRLELDELRAKVERLVSRGIEDPRFEKLAAACMPAEKTT